MTSTRQTADRDSDTQEWTAQERAAMKERAKEVKASSRRTSRAEKEAQDRAAVLEKIGEMGESDRELAERVHAVVTSTAPELAPKLWYGMPAYARNGKVVCFFQSAQKFNSRYAMLGFSDTAALDEGNMWPTYFALARLTPADETRIAELVSKAVS
ncbi:DUF1801 domain-containing protein [Streptomyces sp. GXMU-J15]|uniref:DUF1801 domain-containing protein n=1 Tax=Streptomyces fuscus TaxID=3048495 RepID=A0ABT7J669_9ACTN|nr:MULTISPECIES: DUF1801 domain-containing protein [Streptomyces]MDL2080364.1 DUF1801 domain-containing protein [Streptomyces fuscus]SBT88874.1 Uncharacterized conserved protein YdhG, YjbR/CyaY-like superfamily, DUF1801 family [Streptomyces sp. DI166]